MAQTKIKLIADGVIDVNNLAAGHTITTDNIGEGSNLYYTDARVASYLTTNSYATEGFVTTAVANLVDSAPSTLDTLNELAAALGDDPNFATTVTNSIATKLPLSGGNITGNFTVDTNTLYVDAASNNVGIGTSSPSAPIDVVSDSNASGITLRGRSADNIGTLNFADNAGNVSFQIQDRDGQVWISTLDSSPILFNTSATERMRIDSSGNVGFNTSITTVGGSSPQQSTATPKRIVFNNDYSSGTTDDSLKLYLFNLGATRQGFTSGPNFDLQYHSSGNAAARHEFYLNNQLKASVKSSGISFPNGLGIDFSATGGAAGRTSNLLDDYEEGTFTPVFISTGGGTATYSAQAGNYTKIGRLVHLNIRVTLTNKSGLNAGNVTIGSLPFAISGSIKGRIAVNFGSVNNIPGYSVNDLALTWLGANQVILSPNGATQVTVADLTNTSQIDLQVTYQA